MGVIVRNRLLTPEGRPLQRQTVRIRLVTPSGGWVGADAQAEVRSIATVSTDREGLWSADLIPAPDLPELAYYLVDEIDGLVDRRVWAIRVPDEPGPLWLSDLLVDAIEFGPPDPTLPDGVPLVHVIDSHGRLTLVPLGETGVPTERLIRALSWTQPTEADVWTIPHPGFRLIGQPVVRDTIGVVEPDVGGDDGQTVIEFGYPTLGRADLTLSKITEG